MSIAESQRTSTRRFARTANIAADILDDTDNEKSAIDILASVDG